MTMINKKNPDQTAMDMSQLSSYTWYFTAAQDKIFSVSLFMVLKKVSH